MGYWFKSPGDAVRTILISFLAAFLLIPVNAARADPSLSRRYNCIACHTYTGGMLVGPAFRDVANKYKGNAQAKTYLLNVIKNGKSFDKGEMGVWGNIPKPPIPIPDADAESLVDWILSLSAGQ